MFYSMNAYSSNSNNPYARKYLTKGRKGSDSCVYLDTKNYLMEPKTKKMKREPFNFFIDDNEMHNDFSEFYEYNYELDRNHPIQCDNYSYLNYNENQNISDENSQFITDNDDIDKYSIDFLDQEDVILDSFLIDPPAINNDSTFFDPQLSVPMKRKRKQGIVGRPTLSSPQRLLMPDNVYSHSPIDCFTDNNHRPRSNNNASPIATVVTGSSRRRQTIESVEESPGNRNSARSRPRILLKPSLTGYHNSSSHNLVLSSSMCTIDMQDANDIAQRLVANREFARNLVARAERQGALIDKNKIPMSLFEDISATVNTVTMDNVVVVPHSIQPPSELIGTVSRRTKRGGTVVSVNNSASMVSASHMATVSMATATTMAAAAPRRPPAVTASDLLKQKWRAANRMQS